MSENITGHHTKEQIDKAFAKAPAILHELTEMGVQTPSFQLYEDASGVLWLGDRVTGEQFERACELVKSHRRAIWSDKIGIQFCCGLVDHD